MRTAQRILKNFTSLLAGAFFSGILGLLVNAYLARVIGPGGFGKIGFAVAIITYFGLFTDLGLNNLGVREVAKDRKLLSGYTANIFAIKLILAIISFALLSIFIIFLPKPHEIKALILLFGLGIIVKPGSISWVFLALERMEIPSAVELLGSFLYLILVLIFVRSQEDLLHLPIIQLAIGSFSLLIFLGIFWLKFGYRSAWIDLSGWKHLLVQALPMGLSFIMVQVYYNLDVIMLGFMRTNEEVGYYTAAYKIILILIAVASFYFSAIYPVLSRFFHVSADKFKALVVLSFKYSVLTIVPSAVFLVVFSRQIIVLFFGQNYIQSVLAFQILMLAVCAIWVAGPFSYSLNAIGKQADFLKATIFGAVTNIVFNLIFIPRFGLVGAAAVTVASELFVLLVVLYYFSRIVSFKADLGRSARFCILVIIYSCVVLLLKNGNIYAAFALCSIFYLTLLAVFRIVDLKEIDQLKRYIAG